METKNNIQIQIGHELANLSSNTKAWVYTSNKPFSKKETDEITALAIAFLSQWDSHGKQVKGSIQLIENQFIAIFADTQDDTMCGRAQDASVRFIKELEKNTGRTLMDRMLLAYELGEGIVVENINTIRAKLKTGEITKDTYFYNGLIQLKSDFLTNWRIPIKGSWLC